MAKKELFTVDELKKTLDGKQGFIVINQPEKSTAVRTKIHKSSCSNLTERFDGMYSADPNKKLGGNNGQTYYHYDSYDEAMVDFPKATPCELCKPTSST